MRHPILSAALMLLLAVPAQAQTPPAPDWDHALPEKAFEALPKAASTPAPPEASEAPAAKAVPAIDADTLLRRPELLHQAVVSSIALDNTAALRQLLPLYRRLPEHHPQRDPHLELLAQARINAADGKNALAAEQYARVLQRYPELHTVRTDYALNLFHARYDKEAGRELAAVRDDVRQPESVRAGAVHYLDAVKARRRWQFYGGGHYTREANINNSPGQEVVEIGGHYWRPAKPKRAEGIAYRVGAAKDTPLWRNYFWRKELDADGRFYWNAHDYDEHTLRLAGGFARLSPRHSSALLPYYEKMWYGGQPYSQEAGLRLEQQSRIGRDHRLSLTAQAGQERFRRRELNRDGLRRHISATWQWSPFRNHVFGLGYDLARKAAEDKSDAYHRYGWRASWSARWGNGLEHSISISSARRYYQGADFFNIVRKNKEYGAQLGLSHQKIQVKGFRPRLVAVWQKRRSNNPFYNLRKANVFVEVQKQF